MEIEAIKRTQTENSGNENLETQTKLQEQDLPKEYKKWERETHTVKKSIHWSKKMNLKTKMSLTQNNQEMTRPNLRIMGVEECEESQLQSPEKYSQKNHRRNLKKRDA